MSRHWTARDLRARHREIFTTGGHRVRGLSVQEVIYPCCFLSPLAVCVISENTHWSNHCLTSCKRDHSVLCFSTKTNRLPAGGKQTKTRLGPLAVSPSPLSDCHPSVIQVHCSQLVPVCPVTVLAEPDWSIVPAFSLPLHQPLISCPIPSNQSRDDLQFIRTSSLLGAANHYRQYASSVNCDCKKTTKEQPRGSLYCFCNYPVFHRNIHVRGFRVQRLCVLILEQTARLSFPILTFFILDSACFEKSFCYPWLLI